ncbi:unnamed protein product [Bursaphelenchus okinawaensis]|uniref:Uncharacterized protein n=1 Tax=Bursaphelenchus okinawaensis TaxID=465554 RepID=A0A811KXY6_9BILA|nr:unnamed protein product [Bursaphelenchus okinawaensis]CAG9112836.1 unnamed protein product [Bursaphelenchus okinawaensis]
MVLNKNKGTEISMDDALRTYQLEYDQHTTKQYQQNYIDIQGDKQSILKYMYLQLYSIIAIIKEELEHTKEPNKENLEKIYSNLMKEVEDYRISIDEATYVQRYVDGKWILPTFTEVKNIIL